MTLSYDGAPFCGWQLQPGAPSVQGALEDALGILLKCRTAVTGAGRTDTGVNARGYVAHFDSDVPFDCVRLRFQLNGILPDAVSVEALDPVASDFHARFDAVRREYKYYVNRVKDPFVERFSYRFGYPVLDVDAMDRAAALMVGTHDFSCFEKSGGDNKTSICTVFEAYWSEYKPFAAASDCPGAYLCFTIAADRFLRNMVRATVGTLLEVGRGKRSVEDFGSLVLDVSPEECLPDSLEGQSFAGQSGSRRSLAGQSVPGNALFLTGIDY